MLIDQAFVLGNQLKLMFHLIEYRYVHTAIPVPTGIRCGDKSVFFKKLQNFFQKLLRPKSAEV